MISYDFLYNAVYDNFLKNIDANCCFIKLHSPSVIDVNWAESAKSNSSLIIFYDQEPLDRHIFANLISTQMKFKQSSNRILVTSEKSSDSDSLLTSHNMSGFDYFYHALLCIEWYRQHWYQPIVPNPNFDRSYITYNNLMLGKRLYRSNLLIDLHKRELLDKGHVSFNTPPVDKITKSIDAYNYLLPTSHKVNMVNNLDLLSQKHVLDSEQVTGDYSAKLDIAHLQSGFINLVTETIFYENKVHLTEKSFKPIVAKMPFILLAGAGNLQYLRDYGFKTFGDYWDESYDSIASPTQRFNAVLDTLTKLSNLSIHELRSMHNDMKPILEYNYHHFYKGLRPIVVNEFIQGMSKSLTEADIAFERKDLQNLDRILAY